MILGKLCSHTPIVTNVTEAELVDRASFKYGYCTQPAFNPLFFSSPGAVTVYPPHDTRTALVIATPIHRVSSLTMHPFPPIPLASCTLDALELVCHVLVESDTT